MQLEGISYDYKMKYYQHDKDSIKNPEFLSKMERRRKNHYGFNAQQVKNNIPHLVHYREDSLLSVNYVGLIPFIVEALQNQQEGIIKKQIKLNKDSLRIEKLKKRIDDLEAEIDTIKAHCCSGTTEKKSNPTGSLKVNEAPQAKLYQNIPNPFTESTRIEYYLPEATSEARLYIYDMQGYQIENYYLSTFGEGSITIQGGSMQPGMYMYTLIADGREVDTKKMILTR
jgi:hypothetical protein